MNSKISTVSSQFSVISAASGVTLTLPAPGVNSSGNRQRVDSTRSRGGGLFRSRMDSARSRKYSPLPQVREGDGTTEADMEMKMEDGHRPLRSSKRSTVMNDRTMFMGSKMSVYTQSGSELSDGHQPPRPAPLNLTQQPSTLPHSSRRLSASSSSAVGSGFVYFALSKSSSMACTPVPSIVSQM